MNSRRQRQPHRRDQVHPRHTPRKHRLGPGVRENRPTHRPHLHPEGRPRQERRHPHQVVQQGDGLGPVVPEGQQRHERAGHHEAGEARGAAGEHEVGQDGVQGRDEAHAFGDGGAVGQVEAAAEHDEESGRLRAFGVGAVVLLEARCWPPRLGRGEIAGADEAEE